MSARLRLLARCASVLALSCASPVAVPVPVAGVVGSRVAVGSAGAVAGSPGCPIVDLMPRFWKAMLSADASAQVRALLLAPHPEVYNAEYVVLPTGRAWEDLLASERAYVDAHRPQVDAAESYLTSHVPRYMAAFADTFPDYRCDYELIIAPSFGRMDASAAFIQGRHVILFAPDVIAQYHALSELKVLTDHEAFHVYHHQATGVYGAFAEAVPPIAHSLWSEGLASFVSARMNPEASLDGVFMQPGIPEGAEPHLASIARALLAHLDQKDQATFAAYFLGGRQPAGYPPRAGYYVGYLIAEALSQRFSLPELAHLRGDELHGLLLARLRALASRD